jgi:hypothetical protein
MTTAFRDDMLLERLTRHQRKTPDEAAKILDFIRQAGQRAGLAPEFVRAGFISQAELGAASMAISDIANSPNKTAEMKLIRDALEGNAGLTHDFAGTREYGHGEMKARGKFKLNEMPRLKGLAGAVLTAGIVGGVVLANGGTPAEAATAIGKGVIDNALPGVTDGFEGVRTGRLADRLLNGADTLTGTVATGAAVASLIPAAQPVSLPVLAASTGANLAVNLARDVTYLTGLGDERGLIGGITAAVADRNRNVELFESVDAALRDGGGGAATERLADLRTNRDLLAQQIRVLEDYDPNRRGGKLAAGDPAPYKDQFGVVQTSYRGIKEAMKHDFSVSHGQYFAAVMDMARENPGQIAALLDPSTALAKNVAVVTSPIDKAADIGAFKPAIVSATGEDTPVRAAAKPADLKPAATALSL